MVKGSWNSNYEIIRFGLDIIADEQGYSTYYLCVHNQRHFRVKSAASKGALPPSEVGPCDHKSCRRNASVVRIKDPLFLFALGIYKQVPAGTLLVDKYPLEYIVHRGGDLVPAATLETSVLLKDGESTEGVRTLDSAIDLSTYKVDARHGRYFVGSPNYVRQVKDVIRNVTGEPKIDNSEEQALRQVERHAEEKLKAAEERLKTQRKLSKTEFAQKASRDLLSAGFTWPAAQQIYTVAGPGQCEAAIGMAMLAKQYNMPPATFKGEYPEVDSERAIKGAQLILDMGGIPKDNKKLQEVAAK